jgi:hypothetical protein
MTLQQGGISVEIDDASIPPSEGPAGGIYRPPTPTDPTTPRVSHTSNRKSSRSRGGTQDSMPPPPVDIAPEPIRDPEEDMLELQKQMDELLEINNRNRKDKKRNNNNANKNIDSEN